MEFYFSDTNLPTDNYLMKFVKKDPEGFGRWRDVMRVGGCMDVGRVVGLRDNDEFGGGGGGGVGW